MKIKNLFKVFTAIGASVGTLAFLNKLTFKLSRSKDKEFEEGEYYPWQYGKIHYIKKGSGEPLLLIHSLYIGSSHREFQRNIDELSKNHTVYAVDLPGFGYSDKSKITYTAFTYASFIKNFITEVIKKPCAAVGANGGGMFLTIAAKLFPNDITKILLISPSGVSDEMAKNEDLFKRTLMELPLKGTTIYNFLSSKSNIKKFLVSEGFFAPELVENSIIDAFYHGAHGTNSDVRYSYASFATNYMNMDIKDYFSKINQPIFVLWGENNSINPIKNMNLLKELKDDINIFIFEETKIFPHIENYVEFNSIVNANL